MANLKQKLPGNIEGSFYVDSSCINCDTCRQLSPAVFEEEDGYSIVIKQPGTKAEQRQSLQALVACPTGSIGCLEMFDKKEIRQDFPLLLETPVYYVGFNSPKSFGGSSYFIHGQNKWLIDSPRFTPYLVNKFDELGGIDYIFLTHRDDVADASKYAREFPDAEVIIHKGDKSAYKHADIVISGSDPQQVGDGLVIPTPGHTKGHQVMLYDNKFLFTGDHLYWRRDWNALRASRSYCWYNWDKQVKSMIRLLDYQFSWVLPGHGQRVQLPVEQMHYELAILVEKMQQSDYW